MATEATSVDNGVEEVVNWDTKIVKHANNDIFVKGARMHNLKNVDVAFPRNKLIVVTGVSGSGKSSLTMDTLFAEGQRRYAESLSSYARQFLQRMDKPDVDFIRGLCPAIAIEQKVTTRTPRSTVGSMTEIYDYFRLLFAAIGKTYSPISGVEVKKHTVTDVVNFIKTLATGTRVQVLIPLVAQFKRSMEEELNVLMQKGFSRVYAPSQSDKPIRIEDILASSPTLLEGKKYVLIDRIAVKEEFDEDDLHRLADSIQTGFYESNGECLIEINGAELHEFNSRFEADGIQFDQPVPNMFSFNNPYGACTHCEGLGLAIGLSEDLIIPNKNLSVFEDALACWKSNSMSVWKIEFMKVASKHYKFPIHTPIIDLSEEELKLLWHGNEQVNGIAQFFNALEENAYKVQYRVLISNYSDKTTCKVCNGTRLKKAASYVKIQGMSIGELLFKPADEVKEWVKNLQLTDYEASVAKRLLIEINQRLDTLLQVGLGYLSLSRQANTLSGGESQRIQLTKFLGSNLTDSMYILDEPSIGLHSRDTERLIGVLKSLRDLGNTVIVVEHDDMIMRHADHIIDMGPLASHLGGEVVAAGTCAELMAHDKSLTGKYLSGKMRIEKPVRTRSFTQKITLMGCRENNLKNINVTFPLNVLCVVTGVSGSGKTTLVKQTLYPALMKLKFYSPLKPGLHKQLKGNLEAISHVELIDQNPIGKSSRSNPVTYMQAWDEVRKLYAKQPLAKSRGYYEGHFSFNTYGGRCETCYGEGRITVEMQFLADVNLECDVCHGRRFKDEILEVTYKNKNVYDILEMSVDEGIAFFQDQPKIAALLQPLSDVGIGYVKLGQSSNTLSGGEAQRVKLATFLAQGKNGQKNLFIFDEPTTGLHIHDIKKLLGAFNALIERGNSIIVIEHNTEVIKCADWVIDIGPEAGKNGGYLLYEGAPEGLKEVAGSHTGRYV